MTSYRASQSKNAVAIIWLTTGLSIAFTTPSTSGVDPAPLTLQAAPLSSTSIVCYPLIVRVSLTNNTSDPVTILVHEEGAPLSISALIANGDDEFSEQRQFVGESSPKARKLNLEPGDETSGETLVIFSKNPLGLAFAREGRYRVKLRYTDATNVVDSEPFVVNVVGGKTNARDFVRSLREPAIKYKEIPKESLERIYSDEVGPELDLLPDIITGRYADSADHLLAARGKSRFMPRGSGAGRN